jgi:hypothetical protein
MDPDRRLVRRSQMKLRAFGLGVQRDDHCPDVAADVQDGGAALNVGIGFAGLMVAVPMVVVCNRSRRGPHGRHADLSSGTVL